MKKIIVIGGGAAGMLAALAAAQKGAHVTLLEQNEKLGKKVFITGKGRCNVTNAADIETILANIVTNNKFLYSAIYSFDNQGIMDLLEQNGCPLKVERGDRVFPVSDHSSDVIRALQNLLRKNDVDIRLGSCVKELVIEDSTAKGVLLKNRERLLADAVIVCTGGLSYPSCGSTGDGLKFAEKTGHKIIECKPALVPFEIKETWCKDLMGLALKNVSVRILRDNKQFYDGFGEMLFTHFGVSGPLILSASSYYAKQKKGGEFKLLIDLKPALSEEQLDARLIREFEENKGKQFKNAVNGLFPARLIPIMISMSGISPEKKVNEISKQERNNFVKRIKEVPLTIIGTRDFDEAIITQGGISVKDINPSTMESKVVSCLYFAGEILDLDALTGGFNLQIAWSTGHLAGESSAADEPIERKETENGYEL